MSERPGVRIHPSAVVDEPCEIGEGTAIWHFVHVMEGAVIGRGCSLGQNVMIGPGVRVGDDCKIQNNVSVYEGVTLEDGVFCGPSMVFTNVTNPRATISRKHEFRETVVRRGASLGANSTIVCGCEIGECALIGAGAVVTGDVPAFALMLGVPARRAGWVCACGVTLPESKAPACPECGAGYEERGEELVAIP